MFSPVIRFFILLLLTISFGATSADAQSPADNDLLALRFYIDQGNEPAVQSELRRLQLEFPDWTPPNDLSALDHDVPAERIDRIYRRIREGDFDGASQIIEQTGESFPDWSPSEELLETLSVAEAQARFTAAVESGNSDSAIRIARGAPALLRCERINNAWLLAEQYHTIDQGSAALSVYRSILKSCAEIDLLEATLEKAVAVADPASLSRLADLARSRTPDAAERLTLLENRLRAGLGATPASPDVDAPSPTTKDDAASPLAPTASLRPAARPKSGFAKAATSVSSVRAPTLQRSTNTVTRGNIGPAQRAANRGDWAGCLAHLDSGQTADQISQRAWCAFNADRTMQAMNDFRRAAALTSNARLHRDSRYGMTLAMLRMNMVDQAAHVVATTHFDTQQRLDLESQILDKRGIFAFERNDYLRAIAYFNERERLTGIVRRDLALLRGYAYLNSGQRAAAVSEFRQLHDQMATPASRRALSEALDQN